MADSDKDILITPNTGAATDPSIVFSSGATGGDDVTLFVTDDGTITTLSIEGSAGQLFSVSNDLTGVIFSVNDVSGIPSLEVNADGTVSIAEFDGDVGIGTSSPSAQLHVIADSATTNADIPVLRITSTSTGTPATGIGPSIEFESETAAGAPGNLEIGGVLAIEATDVTATSEDFDFVFSTMAAGAAAAERMRISSAGTVTATSFSGANVTSGADPGHTHTSASITSVAAANISAGNLGSGVLPYATASATASAFKVPFLNTTGTASGNFGLLHDTSASFTYNPSTDTLTVGPINAGAIDSTGTITASSHFKVDAANANGYGFWNGPPTTYGIYMSQAAVQGRIGGETTSDYNQYFEMNSGTNRGFVFETDATKLFAINPDGVRSAVDLTVTGALSGTTIGGITEANLVDKSATEVITGSWNFNTATNTVPFYVSRLGTSSEALRFAVDDNSGYIILNQDEVDATAHGIIFDVSSSSSGEHSYIFRDNGGNQVIWDMTNNTYTFNGAIEVVAQTDHGPDFFSGGAQIWARSESLGDELYYTAGDNNTIDHTLQNVMEAGYQFSSTTAAADPGAGLLRFNNATPASVTNLYIDDSESTGKDASYLLSNLADGDIIKVRDVNAAGAYLVASVNGTPTDNTGWWTVPVTVIHSGSLPTNLGPIQVDVEWSGSQGGGSGTVTSVAAGNGLDFTTITTTGSVTLGTPGTTTASSTNAVTATSHTHAVDNTIRQGLTDNAAITTAGWYRIATNSASAGRGGATIYISNSGGGDSPDPTMIRINKSYGATLNDATITVVSSNKQGSSSLDGVRIIYDQVTNNEIYVEVNIGTGSSATWTHYIVPDNTLGTWASVDYTTGATADFALTWDLATDNVQSGCKMGNGAAQWFDANGVFRIDGRDVASANSGIVVDARGDAFLELYADRSSDTELENAYVFFSQDATAVQSVIGTIGGANVDSQNNTFTGMGNNGFGIHHKFATGTISLGVNGSTGLTIDDNDRVYIGQDRTGYLRSVSGDYGSIQVDGAEGGLGTWTGYSIGGRLVLMDLAGDATTNRGGLYDDLNNHWVFQYNSGAAGADDFTIYNSGSEKFRTTGSGVSITGYLQATTQIQAPSGFHGNYDDTATGAWGGPIWGMDDGFTGPTGGANAATTSCYGMRWNRASSTSASTYIGEGMYVYTNGTLEGGIGTSGILSNGPITGTQLRSTGTLTLSTNTSENAIVCTSNAQVSLYHDNGLEFRTQQHEAGGNTSGAEVYDHAGVLRDVGFNTLDTKATNVSDTLEATHCGGAFLKTVSTAYTITLPSATTTAGSDFPVDGVVTVVNAFTSGNYTINASTNTRTLYWLDGSTRVGGASTNRTVGPGGIATIWRQSATVYYIWGSGIS